MDQDDTPAMNQASIKLKAEDRRMIGPTLKESCLGVGGWQRKEDAVGQLGKEQLVSVEGSDSKDRWPKRLSIMAYCLILV